MINQTNDDDEILVELISLFTRNFKFIVLITSSIILTTLIVLVLSRLLPAEKSFLPNKYSARSLVILNSSSSGNMFDNLMNNSEMGMLAGLAGLSGGEAKSDSDLAITLVNTYSFIDKINKLFNLDEVYKTYDSDYPETKLKEEIQDRLVLKEDESTGLLSITYTDIDRNLATNIVNKVTELLEYEFAKIDSIRNLDQLEVVEEKRDSVKKELIRLQNEILKFQNKYNLIDVNVVFTELVQQVTDLQSQLLMQNVAIERYSQVSSIRDPGYLKLINERDAINIAINLIQTGEAGNFPPLNDLPQLALELEELKRELEVQATVYKSIITQLETLKLTKDGTGATFQVLEKARIPEIKSKPSRTIILLVVSFAGFLLSIFFIFIRETWLRISSDPNKMARIKGKI